MDKNVSSSGNNPMDSKDVTRRQFLSRAWWAVAGLLGIEVVGGLVVSLWPKLKAGSFGTKVSIASVEEVKAMPVGTITYFAEQRFYLSHVDSGFLALYRKCTHVGCVVPWQGDDPSEDNLAAKGRFNCPCHSSIFDRYGVVHAGPAPRPLDLFPISIEGDEIIVDTGTIIQRPSFDESQVTEV
jgi:cytochrome b6-f complex iron-sulfur subunit